MTSGNRQAVETMDEKGRWPSDIERQLERSNVAAQARKDSLAGEKSSFENQVVLQLPDGVCLAYHRGDGACLLTVAEFNGNAANLTMDRGDSAVWKTAGVSVCRQRVMEGLQEKIFLEGQLLDARETTLQRAVEKAELARKRDLEKSIGVERMRALYRKNYERLFAKRRRVIVEALAASDSVFLDSLRTDFLRLQDSAGAMESRTGNPGGRIFLWQKYDLEELPKEVAASVAGLRPGQTTRPVPCRIGWIIASPVEIRDIPATPFEKATPLLASLAAMPALPLTGGSPSRPLPARAVPEEGGDDLEIKSWLMPYFRTRAKSVSRSNWSDTAMLRSRPIRLSALPPQVFLDASKALPWRTSAIIKSSLGIWYLKAPQRLSAKNPVPSKSSEEDSTLAGEAILREAKFLSESKSRDFRLAFAKARLEAAPGRADSTGQAYAQRRQKWINENILFENRLLSP